MLVETNALTKRYADVTALDRCTLAVESGEVFGLLGPNGAGKTTLLRLLLGFLRPTSGSATIQGLDCYRQSVAVHRAVSYLPGEARLFRHMRGREVLRFFAEVRPNSDLGRATQIAQRLDLDLSRRVAYMSTGMRQKLALAVTFAADTPLLILDEPTTSLDPGVRRCIVGMVQEAQHDGRTVIFSSHVLSEVEQACDRVVLLRAGSVVHTQVMSELRRRHCVTALVQGAVPKLPDQLAPHVTLSSNGDGQLTIETGELSPLLDWLARLPVNEVTVQPIGLQALYDQYHVDAP